MCLGQNEALRKMTECPLWRRDPFPFAAVVWSVQWHRYATRPKLEHMATCFQSSSRSQLVKLPTLDLRSGADLIRVMLFKPLVGLHIGHGAYLKKKKIFFFEQVHPRLPSSNSKIRKQKMKNQKTRIVLLQQHYCMTLSKSLTSQ